MNFLKKHKVLIIIIIVSIIACSLPFLFIVYEMYKPYYLASDFNIEVIISDVDYNNNGIDDYTDILLGAKIDAKNHPKYDGKYWEEGYPPDDIGVCTDVIWRAFKNAGYNLRKMVDDDIRKNRSDYPIKYPDSNIDFRRVGNLYVFFSKYAEVLTNDINEVEAWQPGDIVIFGENTVHIGIISDKRNRKGEPYVIHNSGQPLREEDVLRIRAKIDPINGHFRWNVQNISNKDEILRAWED